MSHSNANTRKLFETTASTIQAGDSSILQNNILSLDTTPKLKSNLSKSQSSELLALKALQQQQQQQRPASSSNNQVDIKCLNDYILPSTFMESKKSKVAAHEAYLRGRVASGEMLLQQQQQQQQHLDRHRSTSEEASHLRYASDSQSSHHLNFHQSRKLHTDNDLLPVESNFEQQQLKILSNIATASSTNGAASSVVKRHLAASSATNILDKLSASTANRNAVGANAISEFYSASAHEFHKPLSRKIAVPSGGSTFEFQGKFFQIEIDLVYINT